MRKTTDLFELDCAFSQQQPLSPKKFIDEFEQRIQRFEHQIFLDWEQLEELHRVDVLVPLFRFEKNVRSLLKKARQEKRLATSIGLGKDTDFTRSLYGSDFGSLKDPRLEDYKSWYSYIHKYKTDYYWAGRSGREEIEHYWSSSFLYSQYQLLLVPQIRKLLTKIKRFRTKRKYWSKPFAYRLTIDENLKNDIDKAVTDNNELTIALTAIETRYLPRLRGHRFSERYSYFNCSEEEILAYQQSFDPVAMLEWIGWDADKVKNTAEKLLWQADHIDPLSDWYELVRMSHPDMLNKLRGDALIALDHRRAAEILLRFYEDLHAHNAAPPFDEIPVRVRGPYHTRLKYDLGKLDEVLMKFGLSPQPSLVLIIEGETEDYLIPEVMEILGIPQYSSFIRIFNIKGVNKDFELLARYVAPFQLGDALDNAVLLTAPPTHFLVAVDAESTFRDSDKRKDRLDTWVDGIYKAIPKEYRTDNMRNDIEHFVHIETWNDEVFEFAHFTDEELAQALLKAHTGSESPSIDYLVSEVNRVRNRKDNKNIESVLRKWDYQKEDEENTTYIRGREVGKTDLAISLWPILKGKIENSKTEHELNQIPIVKVLLKAEMLAVSTLRKNVIARL